MSYSPDVTGDASPSVEPEPSRKRRRKRSRSISASSSPCYDISSSRDRKRKKHSPEQKSLSRSSSLKREAILKIPKKRSRSETPEQSSKEKSQSRSRSPSKEKKTTRSRSRSHRQKRKKKHRSRSRSASQERWREQRHNDTKDKAVARVLRIKNYDEATSALEFPVICDTFRVRLLTTDLGVNILDCQVEGAQRDVDKAVEHMKLVCSGKLPRKSNAQRKPGRIGSRPCKFGDRCNNPRCTFNHKVCPKAMECRDWDCAMRHPAKWARPCKYQSNCTRPNCNFRHFSKRSKLENEP